MSQVFPDTPGVIYRLLDADPEFGEYIGVYKFTTGQTKPAISMLTPGANLPNISNVEGVECIIHDISNVKRIDYLTNQSDLVSEWKVFLVAWDQATGEDVNNAARRIMQLFRGATSTQTVRTSEGTNARVQTVVTIPSSQPLDVDGLAIYGPHPVVDISASQNFVEPGQTVTITWNTSSSLRASMDNGVGDIDLSGSADFTIDQTITYTITVYNDFTSSSGGIEIVVFDPIVVSFTYEATGVPNQYLISWSTSFAQEVRFDGRYDWPLTGSTTQTVTEPTEFILEAYSTQGTDQASIVITP